MNDAEAKAENIFEQTKEMIDKLMEQERVFYLVGYLEAAISLLKKVKAEAANHKITVYQLEIDEVLTKLEKIGFVLINYEN